MAEEQRPADTPTEQQRLDGKVSRIDEGLAIVLECLRGATGSGVLQSTPVKDLSMALVFSMQGSAIYQNQHAETFDVAAWSRTFSALVFGVFLRPYLPGRQRHDTRRIRERAAGGGNIRRTRAPR